MQKSGKRKKFARYSPECGLTACGAVNEHKISLGLLFLCGKYDE